MRRFAYCRRNLGIFKIYTSKSKKDYQAEKIIMGVLLISSLFCQSLIIDDYSFTNQNWTARDFDRFCTNMLINWLYKWDKDYIIYNCRKYKIHPLIIFTKMQQEQGLLYNPFREKCRKLLSICTGYAVHNEYPKHLRTFGNQIAGACRVLRKAFDRYKPGIIKRVYCVNQCIRPENAATYSLYSYTPYWQKFKRGKLTYSGNIIFKHIYDALKEKWDSEK